MLRYFRINDPYRLLSLFVLLILASLPALINMPSMTLHELKDIVLGEGVGDKLLYVELIDDTPPMMAVADGILNFFFERSLRSRHVFALVILFFQAAYFGILLINNKAYSESSYVPSLIFGFLTFFSFDLLAASPELFASTLLLLALNNLFKEIEFRVDRDSIVLNLGVFLGIASLFVFSYTVFLLGSVFILVVFARTKFRKVLLTLFGYGLVHAAVFVLYYCYGEVEDLWTHFYVSNFSRIGVGLMDLKSLFILASVPGAYLLFSIFMLTREARFTKYQSQLFQVMFLWLAIALVQAWITPERTPHTFLTFIPPVAYFISYYLLLIRRKWISESMLWIFIIGIMTMNLLAVNNLLGSIDYSGLFPRNSSFAGQVAKKKVMIIGDDISLLQSNSLSGYFLNWHLSKKYFEEPDYYENVIKINKALASDPPDVIVDEDGLMNPFMERIPALKQTYRKEDRIYWKR
ncbi:MAG TPA: hypothetical protein VG737_05565 [Cyclobacteriaceae bacterium]|nr:hypothetical protein [Cyclobacteriaceae bacterium]